MRFTLTAAAKEAGVSKGTISKALKIGRLSGERQEDGSFQIDASELFRVYPKKPEQPVAVAGTKPLETVQRRAETGVEAVETAVEMAVLRVELAREREERERERERGERERADAQDTIDDLRKRLDRAEDRILALSAPQRSQDGPSEVLASPPSTPEKSQEPDRSQDEVESLQKRLEWTEARMHAAVRALEQLQEQAVAVSDVATPALTLRGFLARLLGR